MIKTIIDRLALEAMVQRRMKNTGESYDVALATLRKLDAEIKADFTLMWVEEWTRTDVPWEHDAGAIKWLRELPPSMRPTMVAFPPSCVVRPLVELQIPQTVGIVRSWFENRNVTVVQHPDGRTRATCSPDQLEVVAYWRGWTPDKVREILEGSALGDLVGVTITKRPVNVTWQTRSTLDPRFNIKGRAVFVDYAIPVEADVALRVRAKELAAEIPDDLVVDVLPDPEERP